MARISWKCSLIVVNLKKIALDSRVFQIEFTTKNQEYFHILRFVFRYTITWTNGNQFDYAYTWNGIGHVEKQQQQQQQ